MNKNGGSNGTETVYLKYYYGWHLTPDASDNSSGIVAPNKDNYNFNGYWTALNGGTKIINTDGSWGTNITAFTANGTLYARWTAKIYTITYLDVGGGALSGEFLGTKPVTYQYGTTTNLVAPQKYGYIFEGWFANSSGSGSPITSLGTSHSGNITLYAKWTKNNNDWKTVGSVSNWDTWWRGEDYYITLFAPGATFNSNSQFRVRGASGMSIASNAAAPNSMGIAGINSVSSYSVTGDDPDIWYLNDTYTLYYGSGVVELSAVYSNGQLILSATVLSEDNPGWYMWIAFGEGIIVEVYEPEPVWQEVRVGHWDLEWQSVIYGPGISSIDQFRLRTTDGGPLEFVVVDIGPNAAGNIARLNAITLETTTVTLSDITTSGTDVWYLSDTFTFVSDYGTVQMWAEFTGTTIMFYAEMDVPLFGWLVYSLSELVLEVCV